MTVLEAYEKFCEKYLLPLEKRGERLFDTTNEEYVYVEPMFGRHNNGKPRNPPDFGGGI